MSYCSFSDKHLAKCLEHVDRGIEELKKKYPGYQAPKIKSGLRGIRYFIEFPISGKNIDVFSLILGV